MNADSSSTRRWYQLHKRSWFVLALAIVVLITVNLPYDYASAHSRGVPLGVLITQFRWRGIGEGEIEQRYGGWPLCYLRVRSGGYFDYPDVEWSIPALAGDLLVAVLLGALVVCAYEQRRRRRTRRWQLTLSDLCFLMLVVCGIFGTWNMMADRYRTQENAIYQLGIDGGEVTKRFDLPKPIVGPSQPSPSRGRFHTWLIDQLWNHERPHKARVTKLTDEVMLALRQLREIETLVVQNPDVTDDDAVALLASLPYLERLQIDGAQLTDACVPSLLRLKGLRYLRIRDAKLSDDAIAKLAALPHLISLDVEGTPLKDRGLAAIGIHERLRELNVARTNVTERGLHILNGHPKLTRLWLASDVATPESPAVKRVQLINLPELTSLHIPSQIDSLELTNLPSLTQLPCEWNRNELWGNDYWRYDSRFRAFLSVSPFPRPMQYGITAKHVVIRDVPSLTTLHLNCSTIESLDLDVATLQNFSTTAMYGFGRLGQGDATPSRYNIDDGLSELIGRNKSLQSLSLVDVSLTPYGWKQLSSLQDLQTLDLNGSNVTDEDLGAFAEAHKLVTLSLAETQISNAGWDKLPRLSQWQHLDLSGTRIKHIDLAALSELETLNVSDTPLESIRLKDLPKLTGYLIITSPAPLAVEVDNLSLLEGIYLRHQSIERMTLENLPALAHLDLSGSTVDDSTLRDLAHWTKLQQLVLCDTDITDATSSLFSELHALVHLDLENTAITEEGLAALSPRLQLKVLNLSGTNISDRGLRHLSGQRFLSDLYLGRTNVRGPGLLSLVDVTSLRKLSLGETSVTSESIAHLTKLQNLVSLRLSDTKIDDSSFQYLSRLTHLRELFLNGTAVTDQGLAEFELPFPLQELDVTDSGVTADGARSVQARRAVKVSW
ncbi:MAG: hypothetical protein O3C40_17565 [Planctomycetota bacterium]|nr:hypothetical protein [Planctomycetota bacterium]